jgi:hypothetical protein
MSPRYIQETTTSTLVASVHSAGRSTTYGNEGGVVNMTDTAHGSAALPPSEPRDFVVILQSPPRSMAVVPARSTTISCGMQNEC